MQAKLTRCHIPSSDVLNRDRRVHNWLSGASNQQSSTEDRAGSSALAASLAAAFEGHDYSSKGVVLRSVIEALQEFHERDDRYLVCY
jgi:hypothetical protein